MKIKEGNPNTNEDTYIGFVYANPPNSTYESREDTLTCLYNDIVTFSRKGKCMVLGDFNGYTDIEQDFIEQDETREHEEGVPLPYDYVADVEMPRRNNRDTRRVNGRGKEILELCRACNLRILNGRKLGDRAGNFTCFSERASEPSVIDYALADQELYQEINTFQVSNFTPFSDHCKISVNMVINLGKLSKQAPKNETLLDLPDRFKWVKELGPRYREAINLSDINDLLARLDSDLYQNEQGINKVVSDLEDIMKTAAVKVDMPVRRSRRRRKKRKQYTRAVNADCINMMKAIKRLSHKISTNPFDRSLRQQYYAKRKQLKKQIRNNEREMQNRIMKRLEELHENDPDQYWQTLKELDDLTKMPNSEDTAANISGEKWLEHFKKLLYKPGIREESARILDIIEQLNATPTFNMLDYRITEAEVIKVIKKTKNNKSGGMDGILYEMIKSAEQILVGPITKIFNKVFTGGFFPETWSISMIKPLFKGSGSKFDPGKYRGISLMSCMGKLMCSVLNNRLGQHLEERGELNKAQIGFRKGYRTTDHIITLQSIIHKYIHKFRATSGNNKLFVAFVDFNKAYDSVWREALYYKLINCEVNGLFLKSIMSIYNHYKIHIKLQNGLTQSFKTNVGLKQGCVLSPLLFNLFINDLPAEFNDIACKPVTLYNEKISCLMYADDLILMATEAGGLQKCLDKLDEYCKRWKLDVNIEKTKIIIFNKTGKLIKSVKFTMRGQEMETVREYKYLGVVFDISGSVTKITKNLRERAMKAIFKIRKTFGGHFNSCKVGLNLFQHMVKPIVLYGDGAWGAHVYDFTKLLDKEGDLYSKYFASNQIEIIQSKFNKGLLGVHSKASNIAVCAELGTYPLAIDIALDLVKQWLHMKDADQGSVIYDCYQFQISEINNGKCWLSTVRDILVNLDLSTVWFQQHTDSPTWLLKQIKEKMQEIFQEQVSKKLNETSPAGEGNKLRNYRLFKDKVSFEPYLHEIGKLEDRVLITKFRISAHELEIERGRYKRPRKVPLEERVCKQCAQQEIEDERHVALSCSKYEMARQDLYSKLHVCNPRFLFMCPEDKFKEVMGCRDKDHSSALAIFLREVSKERGSL